MTYTSDIRGAGTDAGVHAELLDAAGASSGRQQLSAPTGAHDAFGRGRVGEFRLRCQALGDLVKLRIGHDGKGTQPGWHLSKVCSMVAVAVTATGVKEQQLMCAKAMPCALCPQAELLSCLALRCRWR